MERGQRRFERHLAEARLPPGKTLDTFDFAAVPMISKAQVQTLAAGDAWMEKGANLLRFRTARRRKVASGGGARLGADRKRLARPVRQDDGTSCQKLKSQGAISLLEAAINKLDKYHLLILD